MQIRIRHIIELPLPEHTGHAVQHLLLVPQSGATQAVKSWSVLIEGRDSGVRFIDAFGNVAISNAITRPPQKVAISVEGVVETLGGSGGVGRLPGDPVPAIFKQVTALTRAPVTLYGKFRGLETSGTPRLEILHELMDRVHEGTTGARSTTSAAEQAHAFIGGARALDIPARFVSGYVLAEMGESGPHSWAEAWDDQLGWVAFDPTFGACPSGRHVRVAVGLDATTAAAVRSHPSFIREGVGKIEIGVAEDAGQ